VANQWAARTLEGIVLELMAPARRYGPQRSAHGKSEHWDDSMEPPELVVIVAELAGPRSALLGRFDVADPSSRERFPTRGFGVVAKGRPALVEEAIPVRQRTGSPSSRSDQLTTSPTENWRIGFPELSAHECV